MSAPLDVAFPEVDLLRERDALLEELGKVLGITGVETPFETEPKKRRDYRSEIDDSKLPGVTDIISLLGLSLPSLMHWAWLLGTEGKSYLSERRRKGDIGTLSHEL